MEDSRIYVNGQEFNTWFAEGEPSYSKDLSVYSVLEKTTDCFLITLRLTYTESQYYRKYTLYVPASLDNPQEVSYIDKTESTVLFTKDIEFTFIQGENLHNAIMEHEAELQAAFHGYMKQELIKERGQSTLDSMRISNLTDWDPSR